MLNDGGQAFPVAESDPVLGSRVTPGMSLRDYLAAHCPVTMAEYVVEFGFQTIKDLHTADNASIYWNSFLMMFTRMRYEYADALIEERKQADAE
jgi:hypothetical protein